MIRSYTLMCQRTEALARDGAPVVIAGTFSRSEFKEPLRVLKDSLDQKGLPMRVFQLTAPGDEIERRISKQKGVRGAANVDSVDTLRRVQSIFSPIKFTEVIEMNTKTQGHYLKILEHINDLRISL